MVCRLAEAAFLAEDVSSPGAAAIHPRQPGVAPKQEAEPEALGGNLQKGLWVPVLPFLCAPVTL